MIEATAAVGCSIDAVRIPPQAVEIVDVTASVLTVYELSWRRPHAIDELTAPFSKRQQLAGFGSAVELRSNSKAIVEHLPCAQADIP